jgi:chromosome segregation ATPase
MQLEKLRMERELHAREVQQLSLVEKYESMEKTIQDRTDKLGKLHHKFAEIEADISDLQVEFQRERTSVFFIWKAVQTV